MIKWSEKNNYFRHWGIVVMFMWNVLKYFPNEHRKWIFFTLLFYTLPKCVLFNDNGPSQEQGASASLADKFFQTKGNLEKIDIFRRRWDFDPPSLRPPSPKIDWNFSIFCSPLESILAPCPCSTSFWNL